MKPPKPQTPYVVGITETLFAFAVIVLGFLTWNWLMPRAGNVININPEALPRTTQTPYYFPGVSVTCLFVLFLVVVIIYLRAKKVPLTRPFWVATILVVLGALPFAIFANTPVHFFLGAFLLAGFVVWNGYAGQTTLTVVPGTLSGADAVNQSMIIPWANVGSWWSGLRSASSDGRRVSSTMAGFLGLLVTIPIFVVVLSLLVESDSTFAGWMEGLGHWLENLSIGSNLLYFLLGLPVGIYIFALAYGNAHQRGTDRLTPASLLTFARSIRAINRSGVVAPLGFLVGVYGIFIAAMMSNLVQTLANPQAAGFSHADFARRGFFELAVLAGINLAILGFIYLFTKREPGAYPPSLRILGALMSGLTLVMVVASIAKMMFYSSVYGLTRLRVYTTWFMVVMFLVFALLMIWHLRRFRVGTPIVIVTGIAFLALSWANTDGLIARFNVDRYLSGTTTTLDVEYLGSLSDAAVPALVDLRDNHSTRAVGGKATRVLRERLEEEPPGQAPWTAWSWQYHQAQQLLR
jgi:hypothetical protein